MILSKLVKASLAVIATALCLSAQAGNNGVVVSVSADKQKMGANDDVVVNVTMTNTSGSPQYILKWHTAFNEVEESLFDITRDGVKVDYQGAHYKRPAPTAADYFLLKPGASHSARVELSSMYDMSITGAYSIAYHTKSYNLFAKDLGATGVVSTNKELGEVKSDAVSVWIDGSQPRGSLSKMIDPPMTLATGSLSFNKCTASQQSEITSAVAAGLNYANNASSYMAGGTAGPRYTKWFGVNDPTRFATVKAHYAAIVDAFANKPITVDCGCKKTYYAYVYPTQPYTIYVCKAFWTAPMTGTDSKGGTLVHEMSHFNATASTDDWVYGQSGAASLAISNPSQAIDNADSHEYFGENTPFQN
jgi:peptidyl-Lys metalloendopeptidase